MLQKQLLRPQRQQRLLKLLQPQRLLPKLQLPQYPNYNCHDYRSSGKLVGLTRDTATWRYNNHSCGCSDLPTGILIPAQGQYRITDLFLDNLTGDIWTENPKDYPYQADWRPPQYVTGRMAAIYEFTSPSTWVVHLRHNIYFQNIPPVNGRQVVASDIVDNYQRIFGMGSGNSQSLLCLVHPVAAAYIYDSGPDQYTVIFQWATSNTEFINELVNSADGSNQITCPEVVKPMEMVTIGIMPSAVDRL